MLREIKKNAIEYLLHIFENTRFSKKSLEILIRSFHFTGPFFFYLIILFMPSLVSFLSLGIVIIIFFGFYIFNGCILSKIETKLFEDKWNIADIFLELFNMDINDTNRKNITYIIGSIYIIICIITYFYRENKNYSSSTQKDSSSSFSLDSELTVDPSLVNDGKSEF